MVTEGVAKSSKRKQKLYDKFLKKRTADNEVNYKTNKSPFESIKFRSIKRYYLNKLIKFQNNTKSTWSVMEELIDNLP